MGTLKSGLLLFTEPGSDEETMMKAIVFHEYGSPDVLELQDVDKPVVKDDEVLVRIHAASVNAGDWHFMRGDPYVFRLQAGLVKPKNNGLGMDLAGQVEGVGKNVTKFRPNDEVYADVYGESGGAFAEYMCVSEHLLGLKPVNLTFEQAAAVPVSALTALQGLRNHGEIQQGQKVLIVGASGGVGTFAVQIAKSFGAEVTGVCSTGNVDMVRSICADHVIDYTQEDFTKGELRYDLILQLAGTASPSDCRGALTPEGTLVLSSGEGGPWFGPIGRIINALVSSLFVSQTLRTFTAKPNSEDLAVVKELIEAGKLTPIIDRTNQLSEVPDAIRYLEEGHTRGKVVITVTTEP